MVTFLVLKLMYKNPIVKFVSRKNPNNKVSNKLLLYFLRSNEGINLDYKISEKNINIFFNDGGATAEEIVNYMLLIHRLAGEECSLENELVIGPVCDHKNRPSFISGIVRKCSN